MTTAFERDQLPVLAHLRATLLGLHRWAAARLDDEEGTTDREQVAEYLDLAVFSLALGLEVPAPGF